jgi:allantoin racemase
MINEQRPLLIVNPNTNVRVTEWLAAEARRVLAARCEVVAVNAESGLEAIETPEHVRIAANAVVAAVASAPPAHGAIIAAFGDPGVEEARGLNLTPVVGLGETGIVAAAAGGRRFSILTLGERMREPVRAKVNALGFDDRQFDVVILPFSIAHLVADRRRSHDVIAAAVRACAEGVVLLGGAPFAGLGRELSHQTGKMVLDGVAACLEALGLA